MKIKTIIICSALVCLFLSCSKAPLISHSKPVDEGHYLDFKIINPDSIEWHTYVD